MDFVYQDFKNLQNVNADNMDLFYNTEDQKFTAYFTNVPCVCTGVGTLTNSFGQVGSTNQFNFLAGNLRFVDQINAVSTNPVATFASYEADSVTVTASSSPPAQLYVVAILTQTQLDAYKVENTCVISPTAMTLAEIASESNPDAYMPLFGITNTAGVYTVFINGACAFNYNYIFQPHGQQIFDIPGTYNFNIPLGITRIYITAAASGGGGGGGITNSGTVYGGGGGGGGESIYNQSYAVTPGDLLSIVIPIGGIGGTGTISPTNGGDGDDLTITGGVTLTLAHGNGGGAGGLLLNGNGGTCGGGVSSHGSIGNQPFGGNGGATSMGTGGTGTFSDGGIAQAGKLGGGGAGGGSAIGSPGFGGQDGGHGGDGVLLIQW